MLTAKEFLRTIIIPKITAPVRVVIMCGSNGERLERVFRDRNSARQWRYQNREHENAMRNKRRWRDKNAERYKKGGVYYETRRKKMKEKNGHNDIR